VIRSVYYCKGSALEKDLSMDRIKECFQSGEGLLWVHLDQPTIEDSQNILAGIFKFHPLAIEDCMSDGYQSPKVDDYDDYLFMIFHSLIPSQDLEELDTSELDLFLGSNYIVTSSLMTNSSAVNSVYSKLERDSRLLTHGADFLCHHIVDVVVDDYMPVLDQMDEEIDWLEDKILEKPHSSTLAKILGLKHSTLTLRRIIIPMREIVNVLSRDEFPQIEASKRIYFRDIYDHLVRIQDLVESVRDVASGTLDIYLSATSNRMNEVMKALTIVSTIFLPLTFFAGVYGMNFKFFPEINWQYGYLYVWILFVALTVGMIAYFKHKGWF
jgi:magnesium transporter